MARRTKLTPEVRRRIVGAVRRGHYFEPACAHAGIAPATGWEWRARGDGYDYKGRKATAPYAEFAEAVARAEAEAEFKALAVVMEALPSNPRLALDYLARRFAHRWGGRENLHVSTDLDELLARELARITGRGQAGLDRLDAPRADGNGRPPR